MYPRRTARSRKLPCRYTAEPASGRVGREWNGISSAIGDARSNPRKRRLEWNCRKLIRGKKLAGFATEREQVVHLTTRRSIDRSVTKEGHRRIEMVVGRHLPALPKMRARKQPATIYPAATLRSDSIKRVASAVTEFDGRSIRSQTPSLLLPRRWYRRSPC